MPGQLVMRYRAEPTRAASRASSIEEATLPARRRTTYVQVEALAVVGSAALVCWWFRTDGFVALVPLAAATWFLTEIAVLPRYARAVSFRPLSRLWSWASILLLLLVVADVATQADLRRGLSAIGGVVLVPVLGRAFQRVRSRPRSTLIVGDRITAGHLVQQWSTRPEVAIAGVCLADPAESDEEQVSDIGGFPVVGSFNDVARLTEQHSFDQVVVAPGAKLSAYDVRRLSWALEESHTELAVAAEVHGAVPRRIVPRMLGRRLVLSVQPTRRPALAALLKSMFDRVVASFLLLLTGPLLVSLIVAVRLDSAGPGLFRQVRSGRHGHPFKMVKLRTMVIDAEQRRAGLEALNEGAGPLFKLSNDPRITRLGGLLRRTSLDELPQLWNVLCGQMSLIGPRPALPRETEAYDDWIRRRLSVKPGMTGLWQVSGRSSLSWSETVRLDLDYVDNWTLGGDLSIATRTLNAVLRRSGAV